MPRKMHFSTLAAGKNKIEEELEGIESNGPLYSIRSLGHSILYSVYYEEYVLNETYIRNYN